MNQQSVDESLSNRKCTSLLISEASKLYCDLLSTAFYGVRERFHVVAAVSNTTETLAALREHSPQIAIISETMEDGALAGFQILPEIRRITPDSRILLVMGAPDRKLATKNSPATGSAGIESPLISTSLLDSRW